TQGCSTPLSENQSLKAQARHIKKKLSTHDGQLGDYNYCWLCMPLLLRLFHCKKVTLLPFYGLDKELLVALAIMSSLQHALAMLARLITPLIIFTSALNLDSKMLVYMISASLIGCKILSLVQMSRIKLFREYYLGTGLITVVGTSFATLSQANAIFNTIGPCPDAYGMVLGASLICSFFEIFISFVLPQVLQKIFPPIVTGTMILMIGASLIRESGIPNWRGSSNNCSSCLDSGIFQLCPTIFAPHLWGSPEFIRLGFLSFISIMLTEIFGSSFLKNISIIVSLVIGCIIAGAAGYIDGSSIKSAPAITFLWVHTFKIRVYPFAILPMLAVYISLTIEVIGEITASAEVSQQAIDGPEFDSRIQGGVLADSVSGFFSALFTVTLLSIFAQNNDVIVITHCANRTAGKISRVFLSIPKLVLRGVTTFLFGSVAVSSISLAFGLGDLLKFTHLFDGVEKPNKGLKGLFDSITIVLSTPFLVSGIVAAILNLILPQPPKSENDEPAEDLEEQQSGVWQEKE
ncbi:purine permease, partial [Moniliophthora roreri MCA 2997]